MGRHYAALDCYAQAMALAPGNTSCRYNWSTALIALGRLEEAEAALDQVIAANPRDFDAWYNRSTLRRQSASRNHIPALEAELARVGHDAVALVPLAYALAKELEDLGEYARSFAQLERGARARRSALAYRVEDDVAMLQAIAQNLDSAYLREVRPGHGDTRPLFVLGLPRSGTTLVDRILSSHPQVGSRGESSDLALSVMRCAGPATGKRALLERCRSMDPAALGVAYCAHLGASKDARVVDKTPMNYLYLGLIHTALPQARVIHVRRHPLDVCYAMYKTLFRMAYPFSYSLSDLGQYFLAYYRLMQHWRSALPDGFLEIDYEALVSDQEGQSRRLIAGAGLSWDPVCLAFERNARPSFTASAAQVREPMYQRSVGLWKKYARELAPLGEILATAGVPMPDAAEFVS